jgi:lipopolysaccharide transport protein LptA
MAVDTALRNPEELSVPVVILVLLLGLSAKPDGSRSPNQTIPMTMTSTGGLDVDLNRNVGIARGDVVIRRSDVLVCCDRAEAHYKGDQIEQVTCRGDVVIIRPDGTQAFSDVAVFRAVEDRLTLIGRAQVIGQETHLAGDRIVYDIGKDRLVSEGKKSRFDFRTPKGSKTHRPCPPGAARTKPYKEKSSPK